MADLWWSAMRARRLRYPVSLVLCVSIVSAFVTDAHAHAAHAAHDHGAHHHGAHDHVLHDHGTHDHAGHGDHGDHHGAAGDHAAHNGCEDPGNCGPSTVDEAQTPFSTAGDHSHYCMAFVMPTFLPSIAHRISDRHPRPLNEYPASARAASLYRPPISLL